MLEEPHTRTRAEVAEAVRAALEGVRPENVSGGEAVRVASLAAQLAAALLPGDPVMGSVAEHARRRWRRGEARPDPAADPGDVGFHRDMLLHELRTGGNPLAIAGRAAHLAHLALPDDPQLATGAEHAGRLWDSADRLARSQQDLRGAAHLARTLAITAPGNGTLARVTEFVERVGQAESQWERQRELAWDHARPKERLDELLKPSVWDSPLKAETRAALRELHSARETGRGAAIQEAFSRVEHLLRRVASGRPHGSLRSGTARRVGGALGRKRSGRAGPESGNRRAGGEGNGRKGWGRAV